jgi:hypothetical protein
MAGNNGFFSVISGREGESRAVEEIWLCSLFSGKAMACLMLLANNNRRHNMLLANDACLAVEAENMK